MPSITVNGITAATGAPSLQSITLSQSNTVMCIATALINPNALMNMFRQLYVTVGATACSQVGGTYEVAMVLDNSYSMSESLGSGSKMDALHTAATNLVNTLIPSGTTLPTTAISLVPFNALVNVGSNRSAPFLDVNGQSSLSWKVVAKPTWVSNPSRLTLFDTLGTSWQGCVEDRPNNLHSTSAPDQMNYMTTDVAASSSNGESLFVPYFAPDDPGPLSSTSNNFYNEFTYYNDNYLDCDSYSSNSGSGNCSSNTKTWSFMNSYLSDAGAKSSISACTAANYVSDSASTNTYPGSGMTLACKYKGATPTIKSQWFGLSIGPNSNCTTPAITPLTTNSTTLINAIAAMQPTGLTNLGTGFMWGWRTISPTVNPFPIASAATIGQQNPKAYNYGPPSNTKVIILMTDGYNTWAPIITTASQQGSYTFGVNSPFLSSYEAFGFMAENRLANYNSTSNGNGTCPSPISSMGNTTSYGGFRCQMDNMLLEGCTNAKAQGITIYTVGFSISSDAIDQEGINVLTACASSPNNYFQAANGNDLVSKFQQIAASITNLRISQ